MIDIQFADSVEGRAFSPGETISVNVTWADLSDAKTPGDQTLEARLIWYTAGKGERDFKTVESVDIQSDSQKGNAQVSFIAPRRPSSFSGKLITLTWAIEVVALPQKESGLIEFVIAPAKQEILLTPVAKEERLSKPFIKFGSS